LNNLRDDGYLGQKLRISERAIRDYARDFSPGDVDYLMQLVEIITQVDMAVLGDINPTPSKSPANKA
jgi:predicted transcriptional regulator